MQYIIHKEPLTPSMKHQFTIAEFILDRADKPDIAPFERGAMESHAEMIMNFEVSKFVFEHLTKPLAEKIKYTHHIDVDNGMMFFIREDSSGPGILEKMKLNINLNFNPPNHEQENH